MATQSSVASMNALGEHDLTGKVGGFLDRHLLLRALEFLEDNNVRFFDFSIGDGSKI